MPKRVIIASHRRSGTHLTIDAIVNNFDVFSENPDISLVTLDHLSSHVEQWKTSIEDFSSRISGIPGVFKTHSHGELDSFFIGSSALTEFVKELFESSRVIYVHRDGRDVMTSLYHYQRGFDKAMQDVSFGDYIKMPNDFDDQTYAGDLDRVSYWVFHVKSWIKRKNCLLLSFDDFKNDFKGTLRSISQFIDEPLKEDIQYTVRKSKGTVHNYFTRVKKKLLPSRLQKVKYSSVSFRKGTSGGWEEHFSEEDLKFFYRRAAELNKMLGYE